MNRYVFNCLVGIFDGKPIKPMLLSTQFLEKIDNSTIFQAILTAAQKLWPNGIKYDDLWLIVTDQATGMIKGIANAKGVFRNLHHVTCLAHSLHRVSEFIRSKFLKTDEFISTMKKVL